jgi:hypothetical protein
MEQLLDDLGLQKELGESNIKWVNHNSFKDVTSELSAIFRSVITS